jgi:hypothetical protein
VQEPGNHSPLEWMVLEGLAGGESRDYVALWSDLVTRRCVVRRGIVAGVIVLVAAAAVASPAAHAQGSAPGEPGSAATWNEPSVTGFADSLGASSKVWYTIGNGELENAFYPETDTPDTYGLQYAVTNGSSFTELETTGTTHKTTLLSNNYLVWQQVNTADNGDFSIYIVQPRYLFKRKDHASGHGNIEGTA